MGKRRGLTYRKKRTYIDNGNILKKPETEVSRADSSTESETDGALQLKVASENVSDASSQTGNEVDEFLSPEQSQSGALAVRDEPEADGSKTLAVECHELLQPSNEHCEEELISPTSTDAFLTKARKEASQFGLIEISDAQNSVTFGKLQSFERINSFRQPIFSHLFTVNNDTSWEAEALGKSVTHSNCLRKVPRLLQTCEPLFRTALFATVCPGNPEDKFFEVCCQGKGDAVFYDTNRKVVARECKLFRVFSGQVYSRTIRHEDCPVLINGTKCSSCVKYRAVLRNKLHRSAKENRSQRTSASSKTGLSYLSRDELEERCTNIKHNEKMEKRNNKRLTERVNKAIIEEGVEVSEEVHQCLKTILSENEAQLTDKVEKDSVQMLLWKEQKKMLELQNSKSMKWHPMMLKWCLQLKNLSKAAYDFIKNSGFLFLPSTRTLFDYEHHMSLDNGVVDVKFLSQQLNSIKFDSLPEHKRNVVLIFDEMKVKADLVYSKATGKVIGQCNTGSFNEQLAAFAANIESGEVLPQIATHVLLFMAQGITDSYCFSVAHYPCVGFNSDQLYPVVWECVRALETHGLKVRATVCDGATPNRRFYRMHKLPADAQNAVVYRTVNIYAPTTRYLYFIADAPHLVKTTRNCWENSGGNKNTRNMVLHGKPIRWTQLTNAYYGDLMRNPAVPGFMLLNKLTQDHIDLRSYSRMRVHLAAQVLSETVALILELQGHPQLTSCIEFVRMIDKMFDCLNVRSLYEGRNSNKVFKYAYRHVDDFRFKWIEEFLQWLNQWEDEISHIPNLSKDERSRCCLSRETLEGWRITGKAFPGLCKELLSEPGVEYILSERICCQDNIEQHFAKHRKACGTNSAPTLQQFTNNEQVFQVVGQFSIHPVTGNCQRGAGRRLNITVDDTPIPKRPRPSQ